MAQKEKMPDSSGQKPLFRNIDADDDDPEVTEIESFCVNCEKQVRLLLLNFDSALFRQNVMWLIFLLICSLLILKMT